MSGANHKGDRIERELVADVNDRAKAQLFDYGSLRCADADLCRQVAAKIHQHLQRTSAEIITIGIDLIEVKQCLGHGKFGNWLSTEFCWNLRTAQRYMQAAAAFGDKSDTVSLLPPTTIYKLASALTPPCVRDDVVARLEAGIPINPFDLDAELGAAWTLAKQERHLTRRATAAGARRADKKSGRADQRRQQYEAEREAERDRGAAAARALVAELDINTIKRVLDVVNDWHALQALRELIENYKEQAPPPADRAEARSQAVARGEI